MRVAVLLFLLMMPISPVGRAAPRCSSGNLDRLLRDKNSYGLSAIEKEWARAYADRDTASLNCILANEFQITSPSDPDFQVHYKSDVLQWVASRTGSAELQQVQVKSHDSAAAVRGVYAARSDGKLLSRFQFIDFFLYRDNRWQALVRILTELSVK